MIFLVDRDDWNEIVGSGMGGILIIDRHLLDDDYEWHQVRDMGSKHLLGKVEISDKALTSIAEVGNQQVQEVGFPSRNALKRMLLPFAPRWQKEVDPITVINFRVLEVENHWCPSCGSVNLSLTKSRKFWLWWWLVRRLEMQCLNCKEFSLQKNQSGWRWREIVSRYRPENVKSIPSDQSEVVAVIGRCS